MTELWKPMGRWILARNLGLWLGLAALIAWPVTIFGGGVTLVGPRGVRASLVGGSFNVGRREPPLTPHRPGSVIFYRSTGALWLSPSFSASRTMTGAATITDWTLIAPLWIWGLALLAVSRWGACRCRPPREGLCPKCDYDLRGVEDRCPECGETIAPPA
jgi:hypothetical protein